MLMKTLIVVICVIGTAIKTTSLEQTAPVFLWGVNSAAKPALQTVSRDEFANTIIAPQLKDNMVVAFLENNLSAGDLTCKDSATAQSCYAHLQGVSQKSYYANVADPLEALRSVSTEREYAAVGSNGELAEPIKCEPGKVFIVTFDETETGHTRGAQLAEHDKAISRISSKLADCNVVYAYTAAAATSANVPAKRVRRDTAATQGGTLFRAGSQFLIFYTSLTLKNADNPQNPQVLTIASMTVANVSTTVFAVTLNTNDAKKLTFDVALSQGYFNMTNVAYDGITFRSNDVNSPTDFSYYCGNLTLPGTMNPTELTASPYTLVWNSLQFQAPFGYTQDPNFVFGDAWHCVGFFSPGILAGLFVTILMLAITFTAICWMMDINTMDRFDDPKGKTITINTTE